MQRQRLCGSQVLSTGAGLLAPCVLQEATVQEAGFTTRSRALLFSGRALYVMCMVGWLLWLPAMPLCMLTADVPYTHRQMDVAQA